MNFYFKKTFSNLSRAECLSTHSLVKGNSNRHFVVAEKMSEMGFYGIATSHQILAVEELIKAQILYLDGIGFSLRQLKGVKKFFNEHVIRHKFAALLWIIYFFTKSVKNQKIIIEIVTEKDNNKDIFSYYTEEEIEEFRTNFDANEIWWSNLDKLKQRGFYVDYYGNLLQPSDINQNEYLEVKTKLLELYILNDNFISLVEEIKNRSKDNFNQIIKGADKRMKLLFTQFIQNLNK